MTQLKRKKVRVYHEVSLGGLTLEEAINLLTRLKEEMGTEMKFEYQYDYDGINAIALEGTRDETDDEYETRLKKHLASAERRKLAADKRRLKAEEKAKEEEEALRKLYEQLKEKFEV